MTTTAADAIQEIERAERTREAARNRRGLTRAQIERLRQAIDPGHVDTKQRLSYMAQHEVRAELTRIFGYGNWDSQVEEMQFVYEYEVKPGTQNPEYPKEKDGKTEKPGGKTYYRVCYRAKVRLTIRDYWGNEVCSFVEWHAEANSVLPDRGEAHAMAITSVESYALRRAAIGLGDRLGLGLYNDGKTEPLVINTLQITDPESPLFLEPAEIEARATKARERAADQRARMQAAMNVAGEQS